jgi:DNA-directed RNA polymerase subunit D
MKLEILEQTDHFMLLLLEGISIEMLNALRRIILTEIPVMAIDEVIILKNDSPLYDEIVAHRLGLIPLVTDLDTYKLPKECDCSGFGCPLCQVSLTCEIHNTSNNPMVIYSKDLVSNDPKIVPVNPNIPIVKIGKDDKVILEAYATLGQAKDHIKWQAVSNVFYRYFPKIEFDQSKCKDCPEKCSASKMCPEKLYITNGKSIELREDYQRNCTLCYSCEKNCPNDAIKVGIEEDKYFFFIESDGVLPFNVLLKKTFEIFKEKIAEFTVKLEDIEID